MTIPAPSPGQCVICRLAEDGMAYAPFGKKRLKPADFTFTCEAHIGLAKGWHHMASNIRNRIVDEALSAAANLTGEYFDRIGKTDLATFTEAEFETTFAVFLEHFGKEMSERVGAHQAPF